MGLLLGKVLPFGKSIGLEGTVVAVKDDLSVTLKEEGQGSASSAYIHCLPQTIQHQHVLVQHGCHIRSNLAASYTKPAELSTQVESGR